MTMRSLLTRLIRPWKTRRVPRAPCDCQHWITAVPEAPSLDQLTRFVHHQHFGQDGDTTAANAAFSNRACAKNEDGVHKKQQQQQQEQDEVAFRAAVVRATVFDLRYNCAAEGRCTCVPSPGSSSSPVYSSLLSCDFPRCCAMRPMMKGAEVHMTRQFYEQNSPSILFGPHAHTDRTNEHPSDLAERPVLGALGRTSTGHDNAERNVSEGGGSETVREAAAVRALIAQAVSGKLNDAAQGVKELVAARLSQAAAVADLREAGHESCTASAAPANGNMSFAPLNARLRHGCRLHEMKDDNRRSGSLPDMDTRKTESRACTGGAAHPSSLVASTGSATDREVWTHGYGSASRLRSASENECTTRIGNAADGNHSALTRGEYAYHMSLWRHVSALYSWRAALLVNMRRDAEAVHSLLNLAEIAPHTMRAALLATATRWAALNDMEIVYYRALLQQYASFDRAVHFARARPLLLSHVIRTAESMAHSPGSRTIRDSAGGPASSVSAFVHTHVKSETAAAAAAANAPTVEEGLVDLCTRVVLETEVEATMSRTRAGQRDKDHTEDPMRSLCLPLMMSYYRFCLGEVFWTRFFSLLCLPPAAPEEQERRHAAAPASSATHPTNLPHDTVEAPNEGLATATRQSTPPHRRAGNMCSDDTRASIPWHVLDAVSRSLLLHHLILFATAREKELERGDATRRVQHTQLQDGQPAGPAFAGGRVLGEKDRAVAVARLRQLLMIARRYEVDGQTGSGSAFA